MKKTPRVLWLCKARYMNHDVIGDRYGRLFELPQCLAKKLTVFCFCLDYRMRRPKPVAQELKARWKQSSIPRTFLVGWCFSLLNFTRKARPDTVIASSDCLHIILGYMLSRLYRTTFYADLYDDYSTFGLARIPGMRWLYQHALARADGISTVSHTLGRDIEKQFPGVPVQVLESTIDAGRFYPRDTLESRNLLGLDDLSGKRLIGVCGGLNAFHGADVVFDAMPGLLARRDDVVFVVAGKLFDECPLPELPNVRYLGTLPHNQMPYFFSALDVAVVALSDTRFGYYAFPQKAYEVLACGVAVAAADVGALSILFESLPSALYDPHSSVSLADTLIQQLEHPGQLHIDIPTWDDQANRLSEFVRSETSTR